MATALGIRLEDKNRWERRVPLTPDQVRRLIERRRIEVYVQPSKQRIFPDAAYREAGAIVDEDLSRCGVILGVKEIPADLFQPGTLYLFFSHTVKGQPYNMAMLRSMMERRCHLIDYERIVDGEGRRLVLFGRYAGLAGMIETLRAFGHRLDAEGVAAAANPFLEIKQPYQYGSLEAARRHLADVGRRIGTDGLAESVVPCVIGVLGYGNVARGAMEILLDCFPVIRLRPEELLKLESGATPSTRALYLVEFHEQDTVQSMAADTPFILSDYWEYPERYRADFERYLPHLSMLINGIYWDRRYPVMVSVNAVERLFSGDRPRLKVIGDITCDIGGSIEVTGKPTSPDEPCFVYDVRSGKMIDGVAAGHGPVVMAVDNLPCEFPREASDDFGQALLPFLPTLCSLDFSAPDVMERLPAEIRPALILLNGNLTDPYCYLESYLDRAPSP